MTMNKEEAEQKLAELQAKRANRLERDVFCPLINDLCRIDCVCFIAPYVYTDHEQKYYYLCEGFCDNAMFSKDRHVQNNY